MSDSSASPRTFVNHARQGKNMQRLIRIIAAAAVIAVAIDLLLAKLFSSVAPAVGAALIVGSATVLGSVLVAVWNSRQQQQQQIRQELRKQKVEVYDKFMDFWFKHLIGKTDFTNSRVKQELGKSLNQLARDAMVWAPPGFMRKYGDFRVEYSDENKNKPRSEYQILLDFEEILFEMRKDIGHEDRELSPSDLLSLFLSDVHKLRSGLAAPRALDHSDEQGTDAA